MINRFDTDTALLIVDAQIRVDDVEHWGGPTGRRNNPEAEAHIEQLLDAWRHHRLPVFHTMHSSREADSPLRADRETGAVKPALAAQGGEEVVSKSVNGAFFGTDLEIRLRRRGIRRLVVAGFFTNMCVETTVRTSGNLGYDTYLCHDACATTNRIGLDGTDYGPELVHDLSVASLHGEFCTAVTTASAVELTRADNPTLVRVQGNE